MYIYYKQTQIKEWINDESSRQGSLDTIIYAYSDGQVSSDTATISFEYPDGYIRTGVVMTHLTGDNKVEIPYDEDRDLKFFEYYTAYDFFKIDLMNVNNGEFAQHGSGVVKFTITLNGVTQLGLFVFNVQSAVYNISVDSNINAAQWAYFSKIITDNNVKSVSGVADVSDYDDGTLLFNRADGKIYVVNNDAATAYTLTEYLKLSGGTLTGDIALNGNKIYLNTTGSQYISSENNTPFVYGGDGFKFYFGTGGFYGNNTALGTSVNKWSDLYLSGNLSDGTNSVSVANIVSKQGGNTIGIQNGDNRFSGDCPKVYGTNQTEDEYITPSKNSSLTPKGYVDDEISKVRASQNLVDVVADLTALASLSITNLELNDKVQVLSDSDHSSVSTLYKLTSKAGTGLANWTYVGEFSYNAYTKSQTDALLNNKQNKLTAGTNITIVDDVISATGSAGEYTAGTGIDITNNEIAVDQTFVATKSSVQQLETNKEDVSNKTTTLNSSSTNTQYPSAKVVYDNLQDIREVAEGKNTSFILGYGWTVDTDNYHRYVDKDGNTFASKSALETFLNGLTCVNSTFNSQNASVELDPTPTSIDDYIIISNNESDTEYSVGTNAVYKIITVYDLLDIFRKGDNVFIVETDVPDRWFGGDNASYYFYKLETSKIDLTTYYTKTETNTLLASDIADAYDSTQTYSSGDYAMFDGVLKKYDGSAWNVANITDNLGSVSITAQDTDKIGSITVGGTTYSNIPFSILSTSIAIGTNSSCDTYGSVALGERAKTHVRDATAIGWDSYASGGENIAIGKSTKNYIGGSVCFDGGDYGNRTYHLYDPSKIFFRYENVSSSKTTFASYTAGFSLNERLNGLTISDNSITELDYDKTTALTLSANATLTLKTAPSSTGTNLSCKPFYRLELVVETNAITLTLPSGTYAFKTDDSSKATISSNVISLAVGTYEITIHDNKIKCWVW